MAHAPRGDFDGKDAALLAERRAESPALPQSESPQVECPSDELATLGKTVPIYVQWHWFRHAQWHQDEITDALLEALAKEEEGQEGTAKGRGSVFRLMFAALEAAEPTKAALVQSGLPASVVLDNLRAGTAGRTREVTRLAKDFRAYLPCFRQHRKVMEYLTTLNQMTDFPDPKGDPTGDIGRFIGAYMRKHVIVDHDAIIHGILLAALNAHKALQLSAKQAPARAASLALLEKAVVKLDPKIAAEVRQNRGPKVLKDFLDGRAELKGRQAKITREMRRLTQVLLHHIRKRSGP
jgi:hypothetical protein